MLYVFYQFFLKNLGTGSPKSEMPEHNPVGTWLTHTELHWRGRSQTVRWYHELCLIWKRFTSGAAPTTMNCKLSVHKHVQLWDGTSPGKGQDPVCPSTCCLLYTARWPSDSDPLHTLYFACKLATSWAAKKRSGSREWIGTMKKEGETQRSLKVKS
jgi:hypothetical protein